jgi:uncharacterized protein YndB with AHSA1/START domain
MQSQSVTHGTYVIERSYPVKPERVFAALADPVKKQRWFAGGEGTGAEKFEMDFRVGGNERTTRRMGDNTPFPGVALTNHTIYQDIVPDKRVVFAYTMILGEQRISASLVTIELLPTEKGTELVFTDQGAYFEAGDGHKRREHGWRILLDQLEKELARS